MLLLVLDTVRAASLSLHGYDRDTSPSLQRLAKLGVLFDRAYSHSPWTLPSIGSMMTGRYPHELSGTWHTPMDAAQSTLAEVLQTAGYVTAGFVANTAYCSYESGLNRGFIRYVDYPVNLGQLIRSAALGRFVADADFIARRRKYEMLGRKSAADVNAEFLSWRSAAGGRPFFAFLNYFDAHAPYLPPPPFDVRFGEPGDRPNPRHEFSWTWTHEQSRAEQVAYDNAIAYLDNEVGRLIDKLRADGTLDRTLLIVASDHGELFGEHGLMDHANGLYSRLLHVPLIVTWPGRIPEGLVVDQPVGLRHFGATILELLGRSDAALPGESWAALWENRPNAHGPVLSTLEQGIRVEPNWRNAAGPLHSLIVGDLHYIRNHDGSEELYDVRMDPAETRNLASSHDLEPNRRLLETMLRRGSS